MPVPSPFLPIAGDGVDMLSQVTYFTMVVACYALIASFIFSLGTRTHVVPEHNTSRVMTACISAVAALSYWLIQDYYKGSLQELATITDAAQRVEFSRRTYNAVGQLRYMDWALTTPLLLIKMALILRPRLGAVKGTMALVVLGDLFMIVTGYIGEQQLDPAGHILVGPKMLLGAISTIGYLAVVYGMWRLWRDYRDTAVPEERRAFRWMAGTVVTLWGVYPIGYILTVVAPALDTDWIQISFSVADVLNKAGVGVVAYILGSQLLEQRLDVRSKEYAMHVG